MGKAIPIYILEEHHEALLVWRDAIKSGSLPARGNLLLHVDEHSDLGLFSSAQPVAAAFADASGWERFIYSEVNIGNFLLPALYLEIFNRVVWLRHRHDPAAASQLYSIKSERGEGRALSFVRTDDPAGIFDPDRKTYRLTPAHSGDVLEWPPEPAIVLDIDLDYFSCDNEKGESWRIEITRDAYENLCRDRYHKVRLHAAGILNALAESGRFYLCHGTGREPGQRTSEPEIEKRISDLIQFLERNRIVPALIDISRSRHSGYTPRDQSDFIERTLLAKAASLYDLHLQPERSAGRTHPY